MTSTHRNLALLCAGIITITACGTDQVTDTVTNHPDQTVAAQSSGTMQKRLNQSPVAKVEEEAKEDVSVSIGTPVASGRIMRKMRPAAKMVIGLNSLSGYYPLRNNIRLPSEPLDRENYAHVDTSPVKLVNEHPVSTFSIDVDTGAYANVRRFLNQGRIPPKDAVRIEEMINYFSYHYPAPENTKQPFRVIMELAPTPWNPKTRLLHIGIQGYKLQRNELPPANLVFLLDVSGSMQSPNKLGLLKSALKLLAGQMGKKDRISIVVYAGASGVVLEPTSGNLHARITAALDALQAGGSTNGAAGIRLAYSLAEQAFIRNGINRVILATDGDFNVGTVNFDALVDLIEQKRKSGISLTTLGFGTGNYNDRLMEQLADAGNGNYAYIDTINEARKVLVDEISSTLNTIAKDVKIQIEFNPEMVSEYRLIGYENRMLKREDFNNDKIDAGEIGAGHSVTALYEITLAGSQGRINPLRYGGGQQEKAERHGNEIAFLRLRYKNPDSDHSKLVEIPLSQNMLQHRLANTSGSFRFAAAVAAFGDLLRGGKYSEEFTYHDVLELARSSRGKDVFGYRGEFLNMVRTAEVLGRHASDRGQKDS
ncbi:MAG: VWA domain-containing protein [Mariprofundaceae bacterium]|nr:VWA domain-containing protein [Mariprofundaceae bacterium]